MPSAREAPLADDYYLQNFHRLAAFVVSTYGDILTAEEQDWYERINGAQRRTQRLYVRLLMRRGSVFRIEKLKYPEIDNLALAASELADIGLADKEPPQDLRCILAAFARSELLTHLGESGDGSLTRAELVARWLSLDMERQQLLLSCLQAKSQWLTVKGHQYWTLYQLGFFGNLYQDAREFVLQQLGTVRYEHYAIPAQARAFVSRRQLDAHLRYFECEALIETIDRRCVPDLSALIEKLPDAVPGDAHLRRRIDRFRNGIARQLERLGESELALSLYACSVHPPARERRIRLYLAQGRLAEAEKLLQALLAEPFNGAELQIGMRLERRLRKQQGRTVRPVSRFRPATTVLTLVPSESRVEHRAALFYSQFGQCYYTENGLFAGVLGLFIWDIIFQPVAGAFFNPFQSAPADFYQPEFYHRRAQAIEERLQELNDVACFTERVLNNFANKQGLANPLVRWSHLDESLVSLALSRISVKHWRALFKRLLSDLRENTSGLPDLILFPDPGGYELIEIKGPGDTLQQNQIRWMQYFDQQRIPCRVVQVRWVHPTSTCS